MATAPTGQVKKKKSELKTNNVNSVPYFKIMDMSVFFLGQFKFEYRVTTAVFTSFSWSSPKLVLIRPSESACANKLRFYGHNHIQMSSTVTCHTWLQSVGTDTWAKAERQTTCTKEQILANSNCKQAHTKGWSHNAHRGCTYSSNTARFLSFCFILTGRLSFSYPATPVRYKHEKKKSHLTCTPYLSPTAKSQTQL